VSTLETGCKLIIQNNFGSIWSVFIEGNNLQLTKVCTDKDEEDLLKADLKHWPKVQSRLISSESGKMDKED